MTAPSETTTRTTPRAALAQSLRRGGGLGGFARNTALTIVSGFALFMPPAAIYELSRVEAVRTWQTVDMELTEVRRADTGHRRGGASWVWSFREPVSGRRYETRDFAPGDLPFSAPGLSTMEATGLAWQQRAGQHVRVWRSPDGQEVYPSQGSKTAMQAVLALCGAWWIALLASCLRRRRA